MLTNIGAGGNLANGSDIEARWGVCFPSHSRRRRRLHDVPGDFDGMVPGRGHRVCGAFPPGAPGSGNPQVLQAQGSLREEA